MASVYAFGQVSGVRKQGAGRGEQGAGSRGRGDAETRGREMNPKTQDLRPKAYFDLAPFQHNHAFVHSHQETEIQPGAAV